MKMTTFVGVRRSTVWVSTVMTANIKQGKTSSAKHNYGQKSKMTDRDRRILKWITTRKHKTTAEMNTHQQEAVSLKTI